MNITTLIHTIRDAVHNNSAAQTWATTNYGHNHKVYVGIDHRQPPQAVSYPLCHIYPTSKMAGYELDAQTHMISIACGIYDETMATTGLTNGIEYKGVGNIEAFRKLIETAIAAAVPTGLRIDTIDIQYETIEYFPFFLANMDIKFTQDYFQGSDPFN